MNSHFIDGISWTCLVSCLPGPRDFLNIITTKYKLLVSRCCLVLLQKVGFLSAETTHFIQKKKTVYCNSFGRKFIIIDSSAVNKTMENDDMFLLGSCISAASISCERFYAVFWPFKHHSLSTRTYRITIFLLWSSAVLLSTSMTLLNVSSSFEASLYVFIPVVLGLTITISICNTAIWRNFQNESVVSQHRNGASRNRRLTKTVLLVSILALLSWLPISILNVLIHITKISIPWKFYYVMNILNYSNSFVNPIVYVLRIPEFQQALRSCCTKRRPAIKMVKTERQNQKGTPRTPEIELRMLRNDPNRLQVDVEQEDMETKL